MFGLVTLPQRIAACLIVLLIVFGAGFGGGYYTKSKFVKADEVRELTKARKDDAISLNQAVQAERGLQKDLAAGELKVTREKPAVPLSEDQRKFHYKMQSPTIIAGLYTKCHLAVA